ncbi:hypothetical protein [Alteromonas sp. OM2203]|uniref:hypothetical protein n=1 Tax=Alteromonas sp. OM2203 TaxID=3398817 RepID=UPI003AF3711F
MRINTRNVRLRNIFFCIAMLLMPAVSHAAAGWTGKATVTSIYSLDKEKVLLSLSSFPNPGNCQVNSSGDVIINSQTHPAWFSMALTAYTTGAPVNLYIVNSCTTVWANTSFANVGHFRLVKPN